MTPEQKNRKSLFALISIALHGKEVISRYIIEEINSLDNDNWKHIYGLSASQGVVAIAYDGVRELNSFEGGSCVIPKALLIKWEINSENLHNRYTKQLRIAEEIASTADRAGKRYIILKGLAYSTYYRNPTHRECGDIDIYFPENFVWSEQMFCALTKSKYHHKTVKHTSYTFNGISIENHIYVSDLHIKRKAVKLNKLLNNYLDNSISDFKIGQISIMPLKSACADFNFLHMMSHAIHHFLSSQIALRHFCDIASIITAKREEIDFKTIRSFFWKNNLHRIYDSFIYICADYLGINTNGIETGEKDNIFIEKILDDTFHERVKAAGSVKPPTLFEDIMSIWRKLRNKFIFKWKYDKINTFAFYQFIISLFLAKIKIHLNPTGK